MEQPLLSTLFAALWGRLLLLLGSPCLCLGLWLRLGLALSTGGRPLSGTLSPRLILALRILWVQRPVPRAAMKQTARPFKHLVGFDRSCIPLF